MKRMINHLLQCVAAGLLLVQAVFAQTAPGAGSRLVRVATVAQLKQALQQAKAGDIIELADGIYEGRFSVPATASGTAAAPVILRGSRKAVLDGGDNGKGYVLHLQASYWVVKGIAVRNGLKGIMADGVRYTTLDSIQVSHTGEEAIHLRKFSSCNVIQYAEITQAGLVNPAYGEGIYIGSAKNNWEKYTAGLPDRCDSNSVLFCTIGPAIAAECIDIKRGLQAVLFVPIHLMLRESAAPMQQTAG